MMGSSLKYIHELPYEPRSQLCRILDADKRWEELGGNYMKLDVTTLTLIADSKSPTWELLNKYSEINGTIERLFIWLYVMDHKRAMSILLPYVDQKYHGILRSPSTYSTPLLSYSSKMDIPTPSVSQEDYYTAFAESLKENSNEFGYRQSIKTFQSKTTGKLVGECIWMVDSIRHILTGYTRAEIKELKSADRLVDCIEILSHILAALQEVKNEILHWEEFRYACYFKQERMILEEILPLLQGYRHEILNYWNEISHEDCLGILYNIRDLLLDYIKLEKCWRDKDLHKETHKMIHELEDIKRKLNCLSTRRNLLIRRKRKTEKEEEEFNPFQIDDTNLSTQRNLLIRTKRKTEKEEEEFNPFQIAEEWERKRSQVLRRIVEIEEKLKSLSKWMSIFKITIYSTGVLHTVTKYFCFTASENRNSTLMPLLLIGSLGLGTMLAEKFTNHRFKGLFELLAEDQVLLAPILQQYNNTNEVESGIENIFPFHITKNVVEEFSGNTKSYNMSGLFDILLEKRKYSGPTKSYNMSGLLDILLEKRKYSGPDNEKTKIALHPSFPWNWLFSEKSKDVFIIIAKIKLIYHDVQTENPASENLSAICFLGSLFLDGLSVIKEFDRLRSFECRKVCLMGMLKNHLTCEMLALKEIVMKS